MPFKIASWNVNSLRVRIPQVLSWLEANQPDLLALQETKVPDEDFDATAIEALGYNVVFSGQRTYNGVAIISREKATDIVTDLPNLEDPQRRILGVTIGNQRIFNLYVPNGESTESAKYQYKLDWLEKLKVHLQSELKNHPNMILLGDFNIAPEDQDVHDPAEWAGKVLCSEPERNALHHILDLGFQDCFRLQPQPEKSFSWWDYRMNGFKRNRGLRIDLILASQPLAAQCTLCNKDKEPRIAERPSDHAPVVAVFA